MHCIVMTWHWTNCRSYYHHFMTRWMCITWKHNCIACAWWTHDLYQQQSTWWAMKQELSEKFVFVIKEKKTFYSDGVNCFFEMKDKWPNCSTLGVSGDFWKQCFFFKVELPQKKLHRCMLCLFLYGFSGSYHTLYTILQN